MKDFPWFGSIHHLFNDVCGTVEALIVCVGEDDEQFPLKLRDLRELNTVGDKGILWNVNTFMGDELTASGRFGDLALLEGEADEFFETAVTAGFDDCVCPRSAGVVVDECMSCEVAKLHWEDCT